MPHASKVSVQGRKVNLLLEGTETDALDDFAHAKRGSALFCNVHMLMASQDDPVLASAMDSAEYVFADGMPIAWLQSRVGGVRAKVLRGYEAVLYLCGKASVSEQKVGFLGSTPEVLEALELALKNRFPDLQIAFLHSPPMVEGELLSTAGDIEHINAAGIKYLFVGLGCPKQEKWIFRHAKSLNCSSLAVGASFGWLAGVDPMPPAWMERASLAWLHRLIHHPVSMWRRYLVYNSRFLLAAISEIRRQRATGTRP